MSFVRNVESLAILPLSGHRVTRLVFLTLEGSAKALPSMDLHTMMGCQCSARSPESSQKANWWLPWNADTC